MPKKQAEYIKFYNFEEKKIKSAFIIYVDFKNIVLPEDNRKENPEESY